MCRSIKTLRAPFVEQVTPDDVRAAALQYVRKVSGFRKPAAHNAAAFDEAVAEITAATERLLAQVKVRGAPGSPLAQEHLGELVDEMEAEAGTVSSEAYERVLAQWSAPE